MKVMPLDAMQINADALAAQVERAKSSPGKSRGELIKDISTGAAANKAAML